MTDQERNDKRLLAMHASSRVIVLHRTFGVPTEVVSVWLDHLEEIGLGQSQNWSAIIAAIWGDWDGVDKWVENPSMYCGDEVHGYIRRAFDVAHDLATTLTVREDDNGLFAVYLMEKVRLPRTAFALHRMARSTLLAE